MVRDERGTVATSDADGSSRVSTRRGGAIACAVLLLGGIYLAVAPWPSPAAAGRPARATEILDPMPLEMRAEAALERWRQRPGAPDETDDEPANADNAEPIDAYDGLYAGTATMQADSHVVTFKVKVTNGLGSGTQSRRECGTAPVALKVSPSGHVSGMALIFGSTCRKTELAIRGRAVAGTLQLRLGSQYLELSPAN